jgi:hypothetical protein
MAYAKSLGSQALSAVTVPWNAFVAAFLYYVLLTVLVLAIASLPTLFIAVAYLLPVGLYAGLLVLRGVQALAALPIDLGETPHALQH